MIVSFVNLKRGHSGQTANMLAAAAMLVLEDNKRVLVMHTGLKSLSLERALLGKKEAETGIDELKRCFMQDKLSEKEILSHCYPFLSERLFLLAGTKAENRAMFEEIMQKLLPVMLLELQKHFDYVFIDIEYCGGKLVPELIRISGQVVVSTSQDPSSVKEAFELKNKLVGKKCFFTLGRYDKKSGFDYGYMKRIYINGIGKKIGTVPYCTGFMDAMFRGRTAEFFEININALEKDVNYEFIRGVKKTKNRLLSQMRGEGEDEKRT